MRCFAFSRAAASVVLFALPLPASCFVLPLARCARVNVRKCSPDGTCELIIPSIESSTRLSLTLDEDAATSMEDTSTATVLEIPGDTIPLSELTRGAVTETRRGATDGVPHREDAADPSADLIRDLDGRPLSTQYFAQQMGLATVESYTCPEKDVFRGFMSNACRIRLAPGGETAFYKSVVFAELDHAQEKLRSSPHKLVRDAKSYDVVASFLSSRACRAVVSQADIHIPRLYNFQARPDYQNPIASKFSFLFEDYAPWDGWYQQWLLQDGEECRAALTALAKIHAFFWHGADFWKDAEAARELEAAVWKSGSYVQPTAQGRHQYKSVAREWSTKRLKFREQLSSFDYWDNLGERLEAVAEECGRHAHPFADDALCDSYEKYRTFTHGDPKQANLFFRRMADSEIQVGVIDFQWSGFGLASTDMAHFLTAAVHADLLTDGGEAALQQHYFDELQKYLVEFGAFGTAEDAVQNFSYATFIQQYDTAFLDVCRLVIAYTWARFEEPVEKDDEVGCARTMNKTSYNKSIPNVVWLMTRCDEIIKSRGF